MIKQFTRLSDQLHSALLLLVFSLFMLNALGVLQIPILQITGLQIHSDLVRSLLLAGDLPAQLRTLDFLVFAVVGLTLALILPRSTPLAASGFTFLAMIAPFYAAYENPAQSNLIPLEYTLLTILVLFSVNVLFSYFIETHRKQKLIAIFGQYVPPAVVDTIAKSPQDFSLAGEARELSVLFCDIKDFSSMSEKLEPRALAELLNTYFTVMTDVLRDHGATIDKYIGDAIMAFWGAPLIQEDHAVKALTASQAMLDTLPRLQSTFSERKWPHLDLGIGLNTGVMNVGNMGSRYRLAYTVVGDAVNLAARFEALTRLYHTQIIVGEATRIANPRIEFRELDHVRVKGKGIATRIYEPVDLEDFGGDLLAQHKRALNAYYAADWVNAERGFTHLENARQDDNYYRLMRERISELKRNTDLEFDGITSFMR